jgi:hypothetical protein
MTTHPDAPNAPGAPDALATAVATTPAVSHLASHFMLDPATYTRGAELGFPGMSFYVAGRAGVLGDVDADIVTAVFVYFSPSMVSEAWEQSAGVMSRHDAALAFADCAHQWARQHIPSSFDAQGLADLAGKVARSANPAGAPLFAGWNRLPEPDDAVALAVHRMNALRELRGALHSCAVLANGLSPLQALSVRTPFMAQLFGWEAPVDTAGVQERWDAAEQATDEAMAAVFEVLDHDERARLVALCDEVVAATA